MIAWLTLWTVVALGAADRCSADQRLHKCSELLYLHVSTFSSFCHSVTNFLSPSEEEATECVLSKSSNTFICRKRVRERAGDDVETKMCLCRDQEDNLREKERERERDQHWRKRWKRGRKNKEDIFQSQVWVKYAVKYWQRGMLDYFSPSLHTYSPAHTLSSHPLCYNGVKAFTLQKHLCITNDWMTEVWPRQLFPSFLNPCHHLFFLSLTLSFSTSFSPSWKYLYLWHL